RPRFASVPSPHRPTNVTVWSPMRPRRWRPTPPQRSRRCPTGWLGARCSRENLLVAGTDQQQIRQYPYTKGFLDPSLLPTHLVCAQSQVRLEFPVDLLYGPPALLCTYHLSRRPLVQMVTRIF